MYIANFLNSSQDGFLDNIEEVAYSKPAGQRPVILYKPLKTFQIVSSWMNEV